MHFNTSLDFRKNSHGKDPDSHSAALRAHHQFLWSKGLPTGSCLTLDTNLKNTSDVGPFEFSSDSIIATYENWYIYQHVIKQIDPERLQSFVDKSHTIGGMIIFPLIKVNNKPTINMARGISHKIRDRFDLTLECIRRFYAGEGSPLAECLGRYEEFFSLFGDFSGYVDFFFLQDLLDEDKVKFFTAFDGFGSNPLPKDAAEYYHLAEG